MPNFNINDFIGKMQTGLLRSNKFFVDLSRCPPALEGTEFYETYKDLKFYCESVDIPGVLLHTHGGAGSPFKRYGYGPDQKKAYMPAFADARLVLRCDQEGKVFDFMRKWQAVAVNYEFYGGSIGTKRGLTNPNFSSRGTGGQGVPTLTPYEVNYFKQYAVSVYIRQYDDTGVEATSLVLRDAFPSLVADMPLAWAMSKAYAQLPVALSFTDVAIFTEPDTD